ncbi:MAG: hypothetical protein ACKVS8_09610 [Phycisphaerales bacterium]
MTPDNRQTRQPTRAACGVSFLLLVALTMTGQAGALDRMWLAGELAVRVSVGQPIRAIVHRTTYRSERRVQRERPRLWAQTAGSSVRTPGCVHDCAAALATAHRAPMVLALVALPPPVAG